VDFYICNSDPNKLVNEKGKKRKKEKGLTLFIFKK
jgi:hypothetical protein